MWDVMGNCNLPYIGQDTNAMIESYHGNLKATLKVVKSWLSSKWVNWCIHKLLGDVLFHYWYHSLKKNLSFVPNNKHARFILNVVFRTRKILNASVTFPTEVKGCAMVKSMSHIDVIYKLHNP
jgi:hypothetical protein